jgi:hypothetical protein
MRKTRIRKCSVGIHHTIKKKIDICTRIFHFAKRTIGFRELPIVSQLKNAQIGRGPSRTASFRVGRRGAPELSYCTLGRPCQIENLYSKIGRRVDFARDKKPWYNLDLGVIEVLNVKVGVDLLSVLLKILLFATLQLYNINTRLHELKCQNQTVVFDTLCLSSDF